MCLSGLIFVICLEHKRRISIMADELETAFEMVVFDAHAVLAFKI